MSQYWVKNTNCCTKCYTFCAIQQLTIQHFVPPCGPADHREVPQAANYKTFSALHQHIFKHQVPPNSQPYNLKFHQAASQH